MERCPRHDLDFLPNTPFCPLCAIEANHRTRVDLSAAADDGWYESGGDVLLQVDLTPRNLTASAVQR